jgi:hypothetical protein
MKKLFIVTLLSFGICSQAQVKIGDNPATINANSLLELESTNKGFLPPRVALNSTSSISPLTGTVPSGMLIFSIGGTLPNGYYYWNGAAWKMISNGDLNIVPKSADATLLKTENYILASNDITITLPAITVADNGLQITVKNVGTHTDLVTVAGNGGATIDDATNHNLTRYVASTFIANNSNWLISGKKRASENLLDVGPNSSWTTIQEAIDFLGEHMTAPTVIRLSEETYDIAATIVVDLDYSLTFQGLSYGTVTLDAATGLTGKPMFRCISDCYFKMLQFNATTLTNYGTVAGEDAIRLIGGGTYNEVKDCTFDRFYTTILDSSNAELWVFETDISNARANGILLHSAVAGAIVKVAETDFISCKRGVNLNKGSGAIIQLASGGYYNSTATDTAIVCQPATFSLYSNISITGNSWNNTGKYIEGFDFTRSDGRDANVIIESNAGIGDKRPNCFINVLNSSTTTSLSVQNTWYKVNWGNNTTSETCKWTINNNQITYQPTNKRDGWIIISGNVSANANSQNITVGIVKNGVTGTQYGATTIRTVTSDQPFPFSIIVYLEDISANNFFELYARNETSSGKTVKFQDIQLLVNTQ